MSLFFVKQLEPHRSGSGLEIRVGAGVPARPPLRVECGRPRLIRLTLDDDPILWARVAQDFWGYWYVRPVDTRDLKILPPLTAALIRKMSPEEGSAVWFARWGRLYANLLAKSSHTPLHPGLWELRILEGEKDGTRIHPASLPVAQIRDVLTEPRFGWVEWDIGKNLPPLALREPSLENSSRIRSWRKHARSDTLPPVLLGWVSSLDRFVVLDGHDRIQAALLEGRSPPLLGLIAVREEARKSDPTKAQAVADAVALQWAAASKLDASRRPFSVESLNRILVEAYEDRPTRVAITRAWRLHGGARKWRQQVRDAGITPIANEMIDGLP
jgi:hypothetical protein